MLFDTVEFLSQESKIVNPVIVHVVEKIPASGIDKKYVDESRESIAFYDIAYFSEGKPDIDTVLLKIVSPRDFYFLPNFQYSIAKSDTATTVNIEFTISVNNINIGTLQFVAGEQLGVFNSISTSNITISRGDVLKVKTHETNQDLTLSDIAFTLAGRIILS